MGPVQEKVIPSRTKFSWVLKTTPWTDVRGQQEAFAKEVNKWPDFHVCLKDSSSIKIDKTERGLILHTELLVGLLT